MSSQSMKYHELPSFETLVAYQKGDLSAVDSQWIDQLIQNNPMVRAVVESTSSINSAVVKSISKRTSQSIATTYFTKIGFWTKYGVWIGLSSILLIIGFTFLFKNQQPDALYHQTALTTSFEVKDANNNSPSDQKVTFFNTDGSEDDENSVNIESDEVDEVNDEEIDEDLDLNQQKNETKKTQVESKDKKSVESSKDNKNDFQGSKEKTQQEDNTRTFSAESKSSNKTVVLSVQQVQILAKTNPDDFSSSSKKDNNGNPLQNFGNKPGSNSSYAIDDIPKFPGGDRALQNYFVGKLRPIKIQEKDNQYAKSVMIDLEINARGKLKDYTIYGQLHPDHQKALIKAIEELPRFDKGTENITYSLGIAF